MQAPHPVPTLLGISVWDVIERALHCAQGRPSGIIKKSWEAPECPSHTANTSYIHTVKVDLWGLSQRPLPPRGSINSCHIAFFSLWIFPVDAPMWIGWEVGDVDHTNTEVIYEAEWQLSTVSSPTREKKLLLLFNFASVTWKRVPFPHCNPSRFKVKCDMSNFLSIYKATYL